MTSTTPSSVVARMPWATLLLFTLTVFASVTSELLPSGLLLTMSDALGVTPAQVGLLVTAWAVMVVAATVPAVRLTARLDRKSLLIATLVVFAAANIVTAAVPTYPVVLVTRIIGALTGAVSWSVMVAAVPDLVPAQRLGRSLAVVLGGGTLATVVGVPIAAALGAAGHWRSAFWGVAAVLLITAVLLAGRLPRLSRAVPAPRGSRARDASVRRVMALLGGGAVFLIGYLCVYAYIVPLLAEHVGIDASLIALVLFAAGASATIGLWLSGLVSDRWPLPSLLVSTGTMAVAFVLFALAKDAAWLGIVAVVLVGLSTGSFPALLQTRLMQTASAEFRGTAASLFMVVLNAGVAVGALLGGFVLSTVGVAAVPLVGLAAVVIATIWFAVSPVRRTSDSAHQ